MQIATFVPAAAASFVGEWTGRIDGDFTGDSGAYGNFKHSADLTFVVAKDGSISGEGTGWEVFERGGGHLNGRADNVTFKIRGEIVDYDTGEARLRLEEVTPSTYPVFNDQGTQVFVIWPFYNWEVLYIELKEGARVDNDAFQDAGSGDTSGTDEFVITGSDVIVACPQLTITPTMPPSSDPRNLAGPTDTASYRFDVAWEGTTPVRVNFDVQGGDDSLRPSFAFNPANMQSSPINVIMDVTVDGAEEGDYSLTIDAWVIDPDTGEECHAIEAAEVVLVVGESRAADLKLIKRVGPVEITQEETDAGNQNVKITTGSDGLATFVVAGIERTNDAISTTTINVGSNTAASEYDHVDHFAKVLDEKAKAPETPEWIANYFQKYKQPSVLEELKELVFEVSVSDSAVYSCLFAPIDSNSADLCGEHSIVYVSDGELHLHHQTATGEAADRLMAETEKQVAELAWDKLFRALATPNALIIPEGTELTVDVQEHSNSMVTTVVMLEGSAIVVDLASEKVQLVNAGERYSLETSVSGQTVSSTDSLTNIEIASVPQWWTVQIGEFGTAKATRDIEDGDNAEPINMTSIFSDNDAEVWAWVEWLEWPSSYDIYFKWYRPDGSLYETEFTKNSRAILGYKEGTTYGSFGAIDISGFEPAENPGLWKVRVYFEGDLVKEIPFYVTKNTLIKDQSVTYALEANMISDNREIESYFENGFASDVVGRFAGAEDISGIGDIEWVKTTVIDNSAEGRIQDTLKLKGKGSIDAEQWTISDAFLSTFIPTIGIDEDFTIQTGSGDPFPSQLAFDRIIDINIGGSNIKAFVFSGNKKLVEGDASTDMTMISYYEKDTGILVHSLITGTIVAPEIGSVKLDFVIKGTKLSIPTTLTISSIPSEIQQNQDVSVSGTISPPVNEGQVVLTYNKNDASDEPIKRTVTVSNGAFSDTYKMDKDGSYSVTAEYLGSGAYLSSATNAVTLTVAPSGCLIATAAFGSELTPQVQFLRNFRDNHILSTAAGSSFMNVFNSWYYSFSPSVADYERGQPWLQQTVKTAIYPLLGILSVSEKAYSSIPGEYGAVTAGIIASSMIGAVYFWPAAFAAERFGKRKIMSYRVMTIFAGACILAVVISVFVANPVALMTTTSFLVLTVVAISALSSARLIRYVISRIIKK